MKWHAVCYKASVTSVRNLNVKPPYTDEDAAEIQIGLEKASQCWNIHGCAPGFLSLPNVQDLNAH